MDFLGGELIHYVNGASYRVQRILMHTDAVVGVTTGTRHSCYISGRITSFEYCIMLALVLDRAR